VVLGEPGFQRKEKRKVFLRKFVDSTHEEKPSIFLVPFPNGKSCIPQQKISYISRDHQRATYLINAEELNMLLVAWSIQPERTMISVGDNYLKVRQVMDGDLTILSCFLLKHHGSGWSLR
jgi:hemerythrin-like domain-containing protein